MAVSLLVGISFVIRLPATSASRAALVFSYFALGASTLFFFMLGFVCVVFHDCL